MFSAVTISTLIGVPAAWAMRRASESGPLLRRLIAPVCFFACLVAVTTPIILHATAWEATAGKFGFSMLTQTGTRISSGDRFNWFAGGLATAWIHGIHGAGIMMLITLSAIRRIPHAIAQSMRLRFSPSARFWKAELPLVAPWLASGMVAVALFAATEMTVADLYGYRTVADQFYRFHVVDSSRMSVLAICFWPLALSTGLIVLLGVSRRRFGRWPAHRSPAHRSAVGADRSSDLIEAPSILLRCVSACILISVAGLIAMVPMGGIVNKLGQSVQLVGNELEVHWSGRLTIERLLEAPQFFAMEYQWTLLVAITTGIVATTIAWPVVSITFRNRRWQSIADITSVLLVCLPGPLVAMVIFRFFQQDIPGFRFLIQQSIVPIVIASLARAIPIAYWVIRAGYATVSPEVLQAADMKMNRLQRIWAVERSMVWRDLVLALAAAAIFASGDLPATAPVTPAGMSTVPLRLFGLLHSGARYQEATLAFWYQLVLVVTAALVLQLVNGRFDKKSHVDRPID